MVTDGRPLLVLNNDPTVDEPLRFCLAYLVVDRGGLSEFEALTTARTRSSTGIVTVRGRRAQLFRDDRVLTFTSKPAAAKALAAILTGER